MQKKRKLELTWIGKNEEPRLEPRILIEDPDKSYGTKDTQNMLIHGDNLLALKALEQNFSSKIKCIYIDPPFNTGSAFEHYDDSLEHSIWLSLMKKRLEILKKLLAKDGAIFVHIDYNEEAYLRILMDEIFGRANFRNTIMVARIRKNVRERDRVKTLNYLHDIVLFYAKSESTLITPPLKKVKKSDRWHSFEAAGLRTGMDYDLFGHKPKEGQHWRWSFDRAQKAIKDGALRPHPKTGKPEYLIPASDYEVMGTNWFDLIASSFNWKFPSGEKNEYLVRRIIEMITDEGDIVMDSFLGSGTTAAAAHKINRRWIGIEFGDHCYTHCSPRLEKVCDGTDQAGISKSVNWKGGGGFKFYELAPSLLKKDKYGNWIIDEKYNADMLASAMAKHEGFEYSPSEEFYWKQGQSTEKDFIFTTTQMVTAALLDRISEEIKPDESLLICCKSYQKVCDNKCINISIKKIPNMLLGQCEFGKEDYSLNIIDIPYDEDEPDFIPIGLKDEKKLKKKKKKR